MAFCNKCGFKNQDDFVSCKSCGAMLTLEDSQITSSTGLETNIASFLCYLVIWISGLVFVLIEKEDKVVRFHAYQSLIFFMGVTMAQIGLSVIGGILGLAGAGLMVITDLASSLLTLVAFILWIMGMVKAFRGEMYKFPVVGDMAENYSQ